MVVSATARDTEMDNEVMDFNPTTVKIGDYAPDGTFPSNAQSPIYIPYMVVTEIEDIGNLIKVSAPVLWAVFSRRRYRDESTYRFRWVRVS